MHNDNKHTTSKFLSLASRTHRQLLEDRLYYYIVRSWWINGDFFPKWRAENAEYSQVITHITKASYLPISRQHASPILSWKTLLTSPLSIAGSKTRMKYPDFSLASAACKCPSTSIQGGAGAVSCQEALSVLQLQRWFQNKAIRNHLFDIWTAEVIFRIYGLKYSRKCL